jgi:hypothetical protein
MAAKLIFMPSWNLAQKPSLSAANPWVAHCLPDGGRRTASGKQAGFSGLSPACPWKKRQEDTYTQILKAVMDWLIKY